MADEKEITTSEITEEEVPVEAGEAPVEAGEAPVEAGEAPVEAEEAPAAEVEKTPAAEAEKTPAKEGKNAKDSALTAIGIILCVILAPILIANLTMIVKSYVKSDEVPSFGGYCPFIVMTDSMKPTINGGDLVFDRVITDPGEVKKGDIISFFDPASKSNNIVTHRVVQVTTDENGIAFRTKGDANNTEDDDVVPAKNVVGVYAGRISGMGNVVMFMQSTPGLVVCIALPILLLIGYDYFRRSRFEKKQKDETAALMKELEELRAQRNKEE